MAKLYTSAAWLKKQLWADKKSIEQIAQEQGVDRATIFRWATKFGLTKGSRK